MSTLAIAAAAASVTVGLSTIPLRDYFFGSIDEILEKTSYESYEMRARISSLEKDISALKIELQSLRVTNSLAEENSEELRDFLLRLEKFTKGIEVPDER